MARKVQLVHEPPAIAGTSFQDRDRELADLDRALAHASKRLVLLSAPAGWGKTTVLIRLRSRLDRRDPELSSSADGVIYLSATGHRLIAPDTLMQDLCRLVPDPDACTVLRTELDGTIDWRDKTDRLFTALGDIAALIMIDDAHELFTGDVFRNPQIPAFLAILARQRDDQVIRVVLAGVDLPTLPPPLMGYTVVQRWTGGLQPSEVAPFLAGLTAGKPPLPHLEGDDVYRLYAGTSGNPRCLELCHALLRSEPRLPVPNLIDLLESLRGDGVIDVADMAGGLLARFTGDRPPETRLILQTLAVFGCPVPADAVDSVLAGFLPDLDSAPILAELERFRVVRHYRERDRTLFALPPAGVDRILSTLPEPGPSDLLERQPPLNRQVLYHLAATYFEERKRPAPRQVGDLQNHLDEIRIRLDAGQFESALRRMNQLDDARLIRWGQSHLLTDWRRRIGEHVHPGWQAVNRSYQILAECQQEAPHAEERLYEIDLIVRQPWTSDTAQADLRLLRARQLGHLGRLREAAEEFGKIADECQEKGLKLREVVARAGAALRLGQTGHLDEALGHYRTALERVAEVPDDEPRCRLVKAWLPLNLGWLYHQLGSPYDGALAVLREGEQLAREAQDEVLRARYLYGQAAVLCDLGRAAEAEHPARSAAELAGRIQAPALIRDANVALGYAYLMIGELDKANAAVASALRQPENRRAIGPLVLQGVITCRGDRQAAQGVFGLAVTKAMSHLRHESDFLAQDLCALAECGLALCSEDSLHQEESLRLFGESRLIVDKPGVRHHRLAMVAQFPSDFDPEFLQRVRSAIAD